MMNSALRLKITGERLRSLITLRIKDYDRSITRVQTAIETCNAELAKTDKDALDNVQVMRDRALHQQPVRAGYGRHDEGSTSIGFGKMLGLREQIDKYQLTLEGLVSYRAQAVWMHDAITPSEQLEVSSLDLVVLGIGHNINGQRGVFDPLGDY